MSNNTTPTLADYLEASNATYQAETTQNGIRTPYTPSDGDLTPFEYDGQPVVSPLSEISDGFSAEAFIDQAGQIIIAYEGSDLFGLSNFAQATRAADKLILAGQIPEALLDAQSFAQTVINDAQSEGVSKGNIFLTGHSLGGAEAEAAAVLTGLGGDTFGAPGIAIDSIPVQFSNYLSSPLVDYVDYGDPVGNLGADTPNGAAYTIPGVLHAGQVKLVGSPSDGVILKNASQSTINAWQSAGNSEKSSVSNG